jgi:dTDP-4-dehydrorhamnose 3,5-epimerase
MEFVQDNQSHSRKSVLRGMHFQKPPYAQSKLVRVLAGSIQDVVVDMRKTQPTFGKYYSMELSSENRRQLLIPKGFAHGFLVLTESADVIYKCDEYYNNASESGIIYNDPTIGISWELPAGEVILSNKDLQLPAFAQSVSVF